MNDTLGALTTMVRFASDLLRDEELLRMLIISKAATNCNELRATFKTRCFRRGFAHETDMMEPQLTEIPVNWGKLYSSNMSGSPAQDVACCFVLVCGVLLSIPISRVLLEDVIVSVNSTLSEVIERPFTLHHMLSDGGIGPVCCPGQSGSRFVVSIDPHSPQLSPRTQRDRSSSKRRSRSFQYPRLPNLPQSAELGSASGIRGRMILRETSDVHGGYRHALFRSHSTGNRIRRNDSDLRSVNHQIMTLFLANSPADAIGPPAQPHTVGSENGSRWILPPARPTITTGPSQQTMTSSLFPIYTPVVFDFSSLTLKRSPQISASVSDSQFPPSRDLTPTLMTMIQDLINRHIISEGTTGETGNVATAPLVVTSSATAESPTSETVLSRAIRHMAIQFDSLSANGPISSREELKRKYGPLNGYNITRSVAMNELSRHVIDTEIVDELMRLAESQGVRDRPLLVQLQRGQWSRLAPKQFRLAAYMLGPPAMYPPLPEEHRGESARARVTSEFSQKYFLGNFDWRIRIKCVPIPAPIVGIGIIVASWRSVVNDDDDMYVTVPRTATAEDVFSVLVGQLKIKLENVQVEKDQEFRGSLCDDLRWCSSDYLEMDLKRKEDGGLKIFVKRNRIDIVVNEDTGVDVGRVLQRGIDGPMLWDVVDAWNSNSTRNRISQWTSGVREEASVSDSSINRRRRLMERVSETSRTAREELNELDIDTSTEYARWWVESSEDETNAVVTRQVMSLEKKTLVPKIEIPEVREDVHAEVDNRPTTPTSPITRSHRLSSSSGEARILRASKDTRQFEFHPYDPNLILAGSRSGVVSLIDSEKDFIVTSSRVDSSPILGIAWMRSHMNMALYGASSSGLVGYLKVDTSGIVHQPIGRFMNLSSVSINCTDDYFLVSGFSRDVALYDAYTGRKMSELKDIHANFINIIRFSNYSPNLFATSSFDCTCKLWDLRTTKQVGAVAQPVSVYTTPTLNVMCCFSPLDENLLVSGLDGHVAQLSIRKGLSPNLPIEQLTKSIPARNSTTNYRRSVYLADGDSFITSGTDENFMRVIDAKSGQSQGICRFDNLLDSFEARIAQLPEKQPSDTDVSDSKWFNYDASTPTYQTTGKSSTEYVQSLRGHPIYPKEVGVLLYPFDRARSSYICMTRIPITN